MADKQTDQVEISPQIKHLDSTAYNRYLTKLSLSGYKVPDPYLHKCVNNVSKWPEILWSDICDYFIDTIGMYTKDQIKAYRSLEAYCYYKRGHVYPVLYHPVSKESPVCILRTEVMKSQAVHAPHEVWVTVRKNSGTVIAAHCTCMAELGETCNHVAATLFKVEAAYRMNMHRSCTDVAAEWNNSTTKKVKAAELKDIDFPAPMHKQRKYDKGKKQSLRGTPQKRRFLGHVEDPVEDFAQDAYPKLKKLWSLSHTPAIFSTYDRHYFRDESETDTASETEDNYEVSLPATLAAL